MRRLQIVQYNHFEPYFRGVIQKAGGEINPIHLPVYLYKLSIIKLWRY